MVDMRLDGRDRLAGNITGGDSVFLSIKPRGREILRPIKREFPVATQCPRPIQDCASGFSWIQEG